MQYLKKESSGYVDYMHVVRHLWKLQIDYATVIGCGQSCLDMAKVQMNNKSTMSL